MHRVASITFHGLPPYLWMCRHMILTYKHTWLCVYLLNDLIRKRSFPFHSTKETGRFAWQFLPTALSVRFQCVIPDRFPGQPHLSEKVLLGSHRRTSTMLCAFPWCSEQCFIIAHVSFYSAYLNPLEQPTRQDPRVASLSFSAPASMLSTNFGNVVVHYMWLGV